jgi:hypothetical protein
MLGTAVLPTEGYLRSVPDMAWEIVKVGDFDGDGRSDVLWRKSSAGENFTCTS